MAALSNGHSLDKVKKELVKLKNERRNAYVEHKTHLLSYSWYSALTAYIEIAKKVESSLQKLLEKHKAGNILTFNDIYPKINPKYTGVPNTWGEVASDLSILEYDPIITDFQKLEK